MDEIFVPILRMLERLLIVGFGGMAIYLGYKLFFYLPAEKNNSGQLELPGIKVLLAKVGPGVFFLAFGAFILISGNSGITVETTTTGDSSIVAAKDISRRSFAGASNLGIEDKKNQI